LDDGGDFIKFKPFRFCKCGQLRDPIIIPLAQIEKPKRGQPGNSEVKKSSKTRAKSRPKSKSKNKKPKDEDEDDTDDTDEMDEDQDETKSIENKKFNLIDECKYCKDKKILDSTKCYMLNS
jgi:hypothetical protein